MNTRTKQRLRSANSTKVAVAGVVLVALGAGLDVVFDAGAWAGVTGLVGIYITLLAVVVLSVLELLRYVGY